MDHSLLVFYDEQTCISIICMYQHMMKKVTQIYISYCTIYQPWLSFVSQSAITITLCTKCFLHVVLMHPLVHLRQVWGTSCLLPNSRVLGNVSLCGTDACLFLIQTMHGFCRHISVYQIHNMNNCI